VTALKAEIAFWRKKGPLEKLHNLIIHIRRTSQRREIFQTYYKAVKVDDKEFEGRRPKKIIFLEVLAGKKYRNLHRAHFHSPPLTPLLPAPALSAGEYKVSGDELKVSGSVGLPCNPHAHRSKPKMASPLFLVAF
jgi:hypothetical protein